MNDVKLISATQYLGEEDITSDNLVAYIARVSNPANQLNHGSAEKLLRYLIKNNHWSPFEMCNMCVEINTTLAIAPQILRHRSFSFQQFSLRYANVADHKDYQGIIETPQLRLKGTSNRQGSLDITLSDNALIEATDKLLLTAKEHYEKLVDAGVSLESARMFLPSATPTRMYMNGTLRSWIHYIELRSDEHTQKEHRDIAIGCLDSLHKAYPSIAKMLYPKENNDEI